MIPDWPTWQHLTIWTAAFVILCAGIYGIWLGIR